MQCPGGGRPGHCVGKRRRQTFVLAEWLAIARAARMARTASKPRCMCWLARSAFSIDPDESPCLPDRPDQPTERRCRCSMANRTMAI